MKKILLITFVLAIGVTLGIIAFSFQENNRKKPEKQVKEIATNLKKQEKSAKQEPLITTLTAAGDIMLSRWVGVKIRRSGDNTHSFQGVANIFQEADIAFANLESPFYNQGSPITEGMIFKAEPETVEGLTYAGFDMLSLANNHLSDQQRVGMNYTFNHLSKNNIGYCGAGENIQEAHEPSIITKNNLKFAFLCYNGIAPASAEADTQTPGLAWARPEEVTKDVQRAKQKADVVIVSMHHGIEYTHKANAAQKEFAHAAIDAGAETVIGHHPHVVQQVEKYNGKYILYSLGNLIFDQMWSRETTEGLIARYTFKDTSVEAIKLQPVIIEDYNKPRIATEKESEKILKDMNLETNILQ